MYPPDTRDLVTIALITSPVAEATGVVSHLFPTGSFLHVICFLVFSVSVPLTADEDAFSIQHSSTDQCLVPGASSDLSVTTCDSNSVTQLWKWGSGHRLFHVATSLCLALNLRTKTLAMVDCDSSVPLSWRCLDGAVYTVYEMALVVNSSKVSARRDAVDTWQRGRTQDNICKKPYRSEFGLTFILSERETAVGLSSIQYTSQLSSIQLRWPTNADWNCKSGKRSKVAEFSLCWM